MVWDTAGQEEFDAITRTYYRGNAHALTMTACQSPSGAHHAVLRGLASVCRCRCSCLGVLNNRPSLIPCSQKMEEQGAET